MAKRYVKLRHFDIVTACITLRFYQFLTLYFFFNPSSSTQVIATALYSSVSLSLAGASSSESLQSDTTALAKSLVLTYDDKTHISTTNAMMRLIASLGLTLISACPCASPSRAQDQAVELTVHEWGTFTVLQDEHGRALPGVNINKEEEEQIWEDLDENKVTDLLGEVNPI